MLQCLCVWDILTKNTFHLQSPFVKMHSLFSMMKKRWEWLADMPSEWGLYINSSKRLNISKLLHDVIKSSVNELICPFIIKWSTIKLYPKQLQVKGQTSTLRARVAPSSTKKSIVPTVAIVSVKSPHHHERLLLWTFCSSFNNTFLVWSKGGTTIVLLFVLENNTTSAVSLSPSANRGRRSHWCKVRMHLNIWQVVLKERKKYDNNMSEIFHSQSIHELKLIWMSE